MFETRKLLLLPGTLYIKRFCFYATRYIYVKTSQRDKLLLQIKKKKEKNK